MKKLLSCYFICFGLVKTTNAQTASLTYNCKNIPASSGIITEQKIKEGVVGTNSLIVKSKGDKVNSVSNGEIAAVFKTGDGTQTVIVSYSVDSFVAYAGLSNVAVAKGQKIQRGQMIAKSTTNTAGQYEFALQIWKGKDQQSGIKHLSNNAALDIIRRGDM